MTVPPNDPPTGDRGFESAPDAGSGPRPRRRFAEPSDTEVDATFAALTADWAGPGGHGSGPTVVDAEVVAVREEPQPRRRVSDRAEVPMEDTTEPALGDAVTEDAVPDDEGHYEPPEPPPVPTLTRPTLGALAVILVGTFLLLAPGVIGLSSSTGFPLGLIVVSGGLTWLLSRLHSAPPPDSGWDDGARL